MAKRRRKTRKYRKKYRGGNKLKVGDLFEVTSPLDGHQIAKVGDIWVVIGVNVSNIVAYRMKDGKTRVIAFNKNLINNGIRKIGGENKAGGGAYTSGGPLLSALLPTQRKKRTKKIRWTDDDKMVKVSYTAHKDRYHRRQRPRPPTMDERRQQQLDIDADIIRERKLAYNFFNQRNTPCRDKTARRLKKCHDELFYKLLSDERFDESVVKLFTDEYYSSGKKERECLKLLNECRIRLQNQEGGRRRRYKKKSRRRR